MKATDKATGIKLELHHGPDDSVILLLDDKGLLGSKHYTRRIHRYESRADYSRLKTELLTYGYSHGLLPEWERLKTT